MKLAPLGKTGLKVTELCFGILPLGPLQKDIAKEEAVKLLQEAIQAGINFFDTAESYKTQPYLGKALAANNREQLVVATKSAAASYEEMETSVKKSLTELKTDYIDIYHLHAARVTPAVFTERAGALQCLQDLKAKGKIKAVGISTHSVPVVEAAAQRPDIDVIFPIINKLGRGIQAGTKEEMVAAIKSAAGAGKGIYAMKALAGGHLVTDLPAAIEYVQEIPGISSIAVGMINKAELDYNLELFTKGQVAPELAAAVPIQRKQLFVSAFCRGCGACVKVCPNQALTLVNSKAQVDHDKCILCGYCNPVCPEFALRIV